MGRKSVDELFTKLLEKLFKDQIITYTTQNLMFILRRRRPILLLYDR